MKKIQRLLSVMLVLVMAVGMIVPGVHAEETAKTVTAVSRPENLTGRGSAVDGSVQYLSDLYETNAVEHYIYPSSAPRDFKRDTNWDRNILHIYYGKNTSARYKVQAADYPDGREVEVTNADGTVSTVIYYASDIAIGYRGTKYASGLAGIASSSEDTAAYVVYDVSSLGANRFYAVGGITGEANYNNVNDFTLTYNVYGSKTGYADDFVKLATCAKIRAYMLAEFDVDITDMNYIKLEVVNSDTVQTGRSFVWADACVYTADTFEAEAAEIITADGTLAGKSAKAENLRYLSDAAFYTTNVVDKYVIDHSTSPTTTGGDFYLDRNFPLRPQSSNYMNLLSFYTGDTTRHEVFNATAKSATYNGITRECKEIAIGYYATQFAHGLAGCTSPTTRTRNFITYNLSGLNVNRFYAVAGLTGRGNNSGTGGGGYAKHTLTFNVYGSVDNSEWTLLSYQDNVYQWLMAEFDVDITGYNYLKLEVFTNQSSAWANGQFVWADACVYSIPTTSLPVQVAWDDAGYESLRPDGCMVRLLADGKAYGTPVRLTAADGWAHTWENLPKYNNDGTEIVYTAAGNTKSYRTAWDGAVGVLTNRFVFETEFDTSVVWSDEADKYGVRPQEISVQLYADGVAVGEPVALNALNNWRYRWQQLDKYRTGTMVPVVYTAQTVSAAEYYSLSVEDGVISAVSTYEAAAQKVSVPVQIVWKDRENTAQARPDAVTVQLYADGAASGAPVVLSADNDWSYTWENLPKHQNGTDAATVAYTVAADDFSEDYSIVYGDGGSIICTYMTRTDYTVKVVWNDENDLFGKRPESVDVQLQADGKDADEAPVTLDESNQWTHTWQKLPERTQGKYVPSTDGTYTGPADVKAGADVTYLSGLTYEASSNSGGAATTVNYPYGGTAGTPFVIGTGNASFTNGLGVHPNDPAATEPMGWTVYDVSALGADRFYAAVGITNTNGKNGNSKGVRFAVYGDRGDGAWVLLAQSEAITGKMSGEFQVNIDGMKKLKLGVVSTGSNNWSSGSAWVNACVYSSDNVFGPKVSYSVDFTDLSSLYEISEAEGVTTLTYLPKTAYTVRIAWEDSDNRMKLRPETVAVRVYADGVKTDRTVVLSQAESWSATVKLPTYVSGTTDQEIAYTFRQEPVPTCYTESVFGSTISNRYDPKLPGTYTGSGSYAGASGVSDVRYLSNMVYTGSSNISGAATTINYPYGTTSGSFVLGEKDTAFSVGLGMHPAPPAAAVNESWTTYDLSGLQVDRFYAAVGITSTKGKAGNSKGVIFRVYGDYGDGENVLLAQSDVVLGKDSGEFNVNIAGVQKLRLVVVAAGSDHYSSGCAWANACVYRYDKSGASFSGTKVILPGVYTHSDDGRYAETVKAADGSVKFLSDLTYTAASNTTNKDYPKGKPTALDHPYNETTGEIVLGELAQAFRKGLGVHPKPPKNTAGSWTTYDVSGLNVDRFYAVVGITNENGREGKSEGVIFRVYADYTGNGSFGLLAESEVITTTMSGEFNVDISGAKQLKLMVIAAGSKNDSSACAWANACVYRYESGGAVKIHTNNSTLNYPIRYTPSTDGNYKETLEAKEGSVQFLSKLRYLDSSNTTNDKYPQGQPTTYNHPYNTMSTVAKVGSNNQFFYVGLGVHPKNPKQPVSGTIESWTIFDVSELQADRFYSAVGLSAQTGKDGASKGVIFRVYADYSGNGAYELIGQSETITGYMSGEFDLDISGAKLLKLAVVSAKSTHTSSSSFWANACVYSYEAGGSVEIHKNRIGPSAHPDATPTDNYYPSADGTYRNLPAEYDKNSAYLGQLTYLESSNTTNSTYPQGQPTTIDHPYGKPEEVICIGEQEALFFEGLGMHPKNPALPIDYSIDSWTIYDISEIGADRFYSAVGITNSNGKAGKSQGVIFRVYGDYGDGEYKLLGQSEAIVKKMSGEFIDVDISGVKLLKLVVVCAGTAHDSSGCAWAGASLYSTTGPLHLPTKELPTVDDNKQPEPEQARRLSTAAIIGIAAGAVLVLGGGVTGIVLAKKSQGKKKETETVSDQSRS